MEKPMEISATGVPWYRREDYARIRTLMVDGARLPATFDAWLQVAEKVLQNLQTDGKLAVKAQINPDEFSGWCRARGLRLDAHARTQFAAEIAFAVYQQGGAERH